jgi:hypothetical protein
MALAQRDIRQNLVLKNSKKYHHPFLAIGTVISKKLFSACINRLCHQLWY